MWPTNCWVQSPPLATRPMYCFLVRVEEVSPSPQATAPTHSGQETPGFTTFLDHGWARGSFCQVPDQHAVVLSAQGRDGTSHACLTPTPLCPPPGSHRGERATATTGLKQWGGRLGGSLGIREQGSGQWRTHPERWWEVGLCTSWGSNPQTHVSLPHESAFTKHKFEDKSTKNFKMVTTEH